MSAREKETALVRSRYDRIAPAYDALEGLAELRFRGWRRKQWAAVEGSRILEVGVGTGKNLPLHPAEREVVAIDLSERMLGA